MIEKNDNAKNHYAWIILGVCLVAATAAIGLGRFGYTMVLPGMQKGLGISMAEAGDIAAANMAGYLFLALLGGILSSRFGPRVIILMAGTILAASMFLTGMAGNFASIALLRALTGMGSGGVNIPVMGLVSAWFMTKRRGLATGIAVSGSSVGLAISGALVPAILARYGEEGWRYCWFAYALICLLSLILCALFLRDAPHTREKKKGTAAGLQWHLLYKNFTVWHLALIYMMYGFSYIIFTSFYATYLINEGGLTTSEAGSLWFNMGVVSILSGFFWGWISDKIGRKNAIIGIFINQFFCYTIMGLLKTPLGFLLSSVFFALTSFSIPAVMAAAAGDILGARLAPAALGFITLFFGLGQVLGPFVTGRIAAASGSYSLAFVIAGMAALLGTLGSLFLKRSLQNPPQDNR